jgi:hypothetical protein
MFGGAALFFQSIKTVDFKLALAHAQYGATAKTVHGWSLLTNLRMQERARIPTQRGTEYLNPPLGKE